MKSTLADPDSPGALPSTDIAAEEGKGQLPSLLEGAIGFDAECDEEDEELLYHAGSTGLGEKKRRLGAEQVRALERTFEADSKLDPERKARLARDLGLQPRQVAVWFQNRRARWKTKLLERDFAALKARHDALRLECDALRRDKDILAAEIVELKSKLGNSHHVAVKLEKVEAAEEERPATVMFKDGPADSDSGAVFNEEASPYSGMAMDHQCFLGFTSYPPSSSLLLEAIGHRSFLDEGLLGDDGGLGSSSLSWYCAEGWE